MNNIIPTPLTSAPVLATHNTNPSSSSSTHNLLYFDYSKNRYWIKNPGGDWCELDKDDACMCVSDRTPYNKRHIIPKELIEARQFRSVSFSGSLGGYSEGLVVQGNMRILVTSSPKFIAPTPGNWDMLMGTLERMFGVEQLPFVYGWIKVSLEMFAAQKWMAGQVLVLCGPAESGKNLFGFILEKLFGGRAPGKPYSFMTQKTNFNSDFMGCELLTIEDEVSLIGIQARRAFGAKIKDQAVNESCWLHRKHAEALTVYPLQRLLISLNDEPERLQILPPIEPDIEDKIMLLKVFKHPMPMPTNTPAAKEAFSAALVAQLPAFVDFLQNWTIPAELVANRYGITHYHHPNLLECLHELSPEDQLLELIDEFLFTSIPRKSKWYGKSTELDRMLKSAESPHIRREATDLLPAKTSCGRYLGRLADRYKDRVFKHPGSAGTYRWTIIAPGTPEDNEFFASRERMAIRNPNPELVAKFTGRSTLGASSSLNEDNHSLPV